MGVMGLMSRTRQGKASLGCLQLGQHALLCLSRRLLFLDLISSLRRSTILQDDIGVATRHPSFHEQTQRSRNHLHLQDSAMRRQAIQQRKKRGACQGQSSVSLSLTLQTGTHLAAAIQLSPACLVSSFPHRPAALMFRISVRLAWCVGEERER
ncbi:hypothetical protein HDK77DRAFT_16021 [Phyllosticta capitalensis]|uniref:uncharacterized protein n=1 Tax=Phyllosticta capitalensis TaxID=121624 RepID=UPI00313232F0